MPVVMISFSILAQAFAFYCFYSKSKRVGLRKDSVSRWLQQSRATKLIGCIGMVLSVILSMGTLGLAPGILMVCITLMAAGSLVVLLTPLTIKKT